MKVVEEIKSFLLKTFQFESNEENVNFDKGHQLQNLLYIEFTDLKNIADQNRYETTISVNLKVNIDDGKDDPQVNFESSTENIFIFFLKYQMIFSIKGNVDVNSTNIKDDIRDELLDVVQSYIRRDIQYISLDSNFDATSFPLQFTRINQ